MVTDPAIVALISGGMALSGVFVGGIVNFFLSKQRELQEVRAFHRQKLKEMEYRRLQNIESLYKITIDIAGLTSRYSNLLLDISNSDELDRFLQEFKIVFRDFFCTIDLYFPALQPLSRKLSGHYNMLIMTKALHGQKHADAGLEAERISIVSTQWSESACGVSSVLEEIQQALRRTVENETSTAPTVVESG